LTDATTTARNAQGLYRLLSMPSKFAKDPPTMFSPAEILLVEDEPAIVELMERVLHRAGYMVHAVTDGAAALAALDHDQPALLILDLVLPIISGWTILEQVRRNKRPMPIIVVTANPCVAGTLTLYGVEQYLIKPFLLDELLNAVAFYLTPSPIH
jgi:DNA-binding response OmpR family regulator